MRYIYEIAYFKESGKFYSSGELDSSAEYMFQVFEEFRTMLQNGIRPGLRDGHSGFTAVLISGTHPDFYPAAFIGEA